MQQEFEIAGEPDINVLARLPGAMQPVRDGIDERMIAGVERAIDEALGELEQMRLREGEELAAEMRSRLDEIARHVPVIEGGASGLVDAYRARLQKRIGEWSPVTVRAWACPGRLARRSPTCGSQRHIGREARQKYPYNFARH